MVESFKKIFVAKVESDATCKRYEAARTDEFQRSVSVVV
jgi:hypothetical protein